MTLHGQLEKHGWEMGWEQEMGVGNGSGKWEQEIVHIIRNDLWCSQTKRVRSHLCHMPLYAQISYSHFPFPAEFHTEGREGWNPHHNFPLEILIDTGYGYYCGAIMQYLHVTGDIICHQNVWKVVPGCTI